jgi:uracil-DNA glycosylase
MERLPDVWMDFCGLTEEDIPLISEAAYPVPADRFRAFELVRPDDVRVVILGQDPYHGEGEAHGLAFSVRLGVRMPPSLRNIFRELAEDINISMPTDTDLTRWAKQGVLLLNTALSVLPDQPGSHANIGWHSVTNAVISSLAVRGQPCVFVLWGKHAQSKKVLISANSSHLVIESSHPSPLSVYRGFIGSRPFSRINQWLHDHGWTEIDWR